MCITIPSSANVKRARQWALWQWLSATPVRLYLSGGGLFLLLALAMDLTIPAPAAGWRQFNLIFAIAPTLILGLLFEDLPRLLKVTPLTYVRFASLFFLLLLTQVAFLVDGLRGMPPGLLYLIGLGLVWGLSLGTLHGLIRFSYAGAAGRALVILYLLLALGLAGLALAIGLSGHWLNRVPVYLWGGVLPFYLLVLLLARLKGRAGQGSPARR